MCGIWSYIALNGSKPCVEELFRNFYKLKHRGPDSSYFETYKNAYVGFHRLAIVNDTFSSNQPFIIEEENRTIVAIVNGEIYNYKKIYEDYKHDSAFVATNKSDCFTIPLLYQHYTSGSNNIEVGFTNCINNAVKGEYAFIILEFDRNKTLKRLVAGRDHIGVRPLYYNEDALDEYDVAKGIIFTSEIKGAGQTPVKEFAPGTLMDIKFDIFEKIVEIYEYDFNKYFGNINWLMTRDVEKCLENVRESVINSIERRLDADKPIGFLLSGGVDSSLVAAISAKILGRPIRTFCCGMRNDGCGEGTDLQYARLVAKHIGSQHTEVFFTPKQGLDAIDDVIRTIESWDTTSVRASVGQYLVSKYISENTDCKVLMVGEGPDEVCSSYLFNWYAPNGEELHKTAIDYVKNIHYYDVKRADRCIARWGMEARVPLLDTEFIRAYWKIRGEWRMPTYKGVEKWWLREAFKESGVLPSDVLWRKKEAFSDGVSSKEKSWFQIIQEWVETLVSDEEFSTAAEKFPYCTPQTKEAYYYRKKFVELFGEAAQKVIPGYWQPRWSADGKEVTEYIDPSARVLEVYSA
jgi:asparagine synthase (glutamine-hydrolysing)